MKVNGDDLGVIYRALDHYSLAFDEGRGEGLVEPDRIEDEWRNTDLLRQMIWDAWRVYRGTRDTDSRNSRADG